MHGIDYKIILFDCSDAERKDSLIEDIFSSGNILIKNNRLAGVIDFGGMAIGDPSCDLVIAWTFLKGKSRDRFRSILQLDQSTWERARGWALWKALITLEAIKDYEKLIFLKNFVKASNISVGDYIYFDDRGYGPDKFEEYNVLYCFQVSIGRTIYNYDFGKVKLVIGK